MIVKIILTLVISLGILSCTSETIPPVKMFDGDFEPSLENVDAVELFFKSVADDMGFEIIERKRSEAKKLTKTNRDRPRFLVLVSEFE